MDGEDFDWEDLMGMTWMGNTRVDKTWVGVTGETWWRRHGWVGLEWETVFTPLYDHKALSPLYYRGPVVFRSFKVINTALSSNHKPLCRRYMMGIPFGRGKKNLTN